MNSIAGYALIVGYALVLFTVYRLVSMRGLHTDASIVEYLQAGKKIPVWLLTAGFFSSWVWVTTIIGSAEACVLYGVTGALGYSIGAAFSFVVFIGILLFLQKTMPESTSFLEFMGERYTPLVKDVYYLFAVLTTVYVAMEQAAGISFVLNGFFGTSYKKTAFLVVVIAVVFAVKAGMRGVLYNELCSAFIILAGLSVFVVIAGAIFEPQKVLRGLNAAVTNPSFPNYNPDLLNIASFTGVRYTIMAIVIAFGQILFDPAYYLKTSMAKNAKDAKKALLLGGVLLWCPVGIVSAFTLGFLSIGMGIDFSGSLNISADIPTKLISQYMGHPVILLFAFLIVCIGITAMTHYIIGVQSIFTIDFYKNKIKADATESEKIQFGKTVVLLIGTFCGLVAISLENISLLTIDMFCGVFFAAPCGALFVGIVSDKKMGNLPILSIMIGLVAGFYVWVFAVEDHGKAWFLGTMTSFLVPILFLAFFSAFLPDRFNFARLRFFKP